MGHFYLVKMLSEAFVLAVKSSPIIKRIIGHKDGKRTTVKSGHDIDAK